MRPDGGPVIDRRTFLGALTRGLLAAPLAAEAQPAGKVYRIGVVAAGVNPRSAPFFQAFEQRLRELGWVEGKNLVVDFQTPKGSRDLSAIAASFVRQNVDVIIAGGPEASLKAARQATSTIPIVMVALNYDPVAKGHVTSLGHPGGNVTGVLSLAPEQGAKQLELLKEVLPKVTRMGVLWDVFAADQMPILEASAPKLNVQLEKVEVRPQYDLGRAFLTLRQRRVGAVLVVGSPTFFRDQAKIAALAIQHHLPAGGSVSYVAGGLLLGYGVPAGVPYAHAADYVDRILKGAKPGDLPIEQPTKFELVINLKTAKALGLTIPPSLLQRADQVIE
jgi:putative ABC transport system substrate-binding protein